MKVRLLGSDIAWPGRAGELQSAGDLDALVAELGSAYETYHAFLARRVDELNARPTRPSEQTVPQWLLPVAERQALAAAEVALRMARLTVEEGRTATGHGSVFSGRREPATVFTSSHPVFDGDGRLVSILDPLPAPIPEVPPNERPKPPTAAELRLPRPRLRPY